MNSRNRWPQTIAAVGVGVAIGAALGLLFAPKSGEEAREFLVDSARDGVDAVVSRGQKFTRRAQEVVSQARDQMQDVSDAGERAFDQARRT